LWQAFLALLTTSVQAQLTFELPDGYLDARTLTVQSKVEELFQRGEFERAYFIYRNELVPAGDKYAQYMVGYMHLTGMGTDEDSISACAWYRLAAERGTPEFVAVRDQLMHDLETEERRRSDAYYLQLRREYSDLAILLGSIKRGVRGLEPRTGSRLAGQASSLMVIDMNSANKSHTAADSYRSTRTKLREQLIMLSEIGGFPELETDPSRVDIDHIERLVNERLDAPLEQDY
jgi:hypothetical protein